tara:strand:+ start:22857 stop:23567 length:711 start_codon:yes stop_codon:yes gene_type:complete
MTTLLTDTRHLVVDQNDGIEMHHARAKKAVALSRAFEADWYALSLRVSLADDNSAAFSVVHVDEEENETIVTEPSATVPDLADVLDAAQEAGLDADEGREEQRDSGSVVPEQYRKRYYVESTTGRSCGDWLAETLAVWTLDGNSKLMVEAFEQILRENSVDLDHASWAHSRSPGWQGRFRMSGRIALEKLVAKHGVLYDDQGTKHEVPEEALSILRTKHAKWLAKEEKLEALHKAD